jgi:hypothetical protein
MQMVKRIVGGFFLSLILLWLFAPKVELYYLLEKSLKEKSIIISNESISDTWYGLKIENAELYVAGAKVAKVAELNFNFFLFYNTLKINEITMDKSLSNMAPKAINNLDLVYSILNPLNVKLDGTGSFGILDGAVALIDKKSRNFISCSKRTKDNQKVFEKRQRERMVL